MTAFHHQKPAALFLCSHLKSVNRTYLPNFHIVTFKFLITFTDISCIKAAHEVKTNMHTAPPAKSGANNRNSALFL